VASEKWFRNKSLHSQNPSPLAFALMRFFTRRPTTQAGEKSPNMTI
jgi:hypothetical protein